MPPPRLPIQSNECIDQRDYNTPTDKPQRPTHPWSSNDIAEHTLPTTHKGNNRVRFYDTYFLQENGDIVLLSYGVLLDRHIICCFNVFGILSVVGILLYCGSLSWYACNDCFVVCFFMGALRCLLLFCCNVSLPDARLF